MNVVSVRIQSDTDMLDNIENVRQYDTGEDQMIPQIEGNISQYKKDLKRKYGIQKLETFTFDSVLKTLIE